MTGLQSFIMALIHVPAIRPSDFSCVQVVPRKVSCQCAKLTRNSRGASELSLSLFHYFLVSVAYGNKGLLLMTTSPLY